MELLRTYIREVLSSPCSDKEFDEILATAQQLHHGQTRRSGEDYISHPVEVAFIIKQYYPNDDILCKAALLHDTLEDAPALGNVKDEQELFAMIASASDSDAEAASLVHLVVALTKSEGSDYAEYVLSLAADPDALKIKLADMLHNIQHSPSERQLAKYQNALKALEDKFAGIPPGLNPQHWEDIKIAAQNMTEAPIYKDINRSMLMGETKAAKKPGAGVVVIREFKDGWRILGLRVYGKYDLPKGAIDPGEDAFTAAVRETNEEAGISDLKFKWGTEALALDHLKMYIAETAQDPVILKNPHSGIYEHHAAEWFSWDDIAGRVYPYLRPAIIWARDIVENKQ